MDWKKIPIIKLDSVDFDKITVARFLEIQKQDFFTAMYPFLAEERDWVILDLGTGNGLCELVIRYKIEIHTAR